MDADLAERIDARLTELGLRLTGFRFTDLTTDEPARGRLAYKGHTQPVLALEGPPRVEHGSLRVVGPHVGLETIILAAEHVSETDAELYRSLDINYLDSRGNASIRFGPVLIDVRGRRQDRTVHRARQATTTEPVSKNLYSPKRAQVIFALLTQPEAEAATVRKLARLASVSVGIAQETLTALEDLKYLVPAPRRKIRRRQALIEGWIAAYPSGLGSPARARSFHGDPNTFEASTAPIFLSGESALLDEDSQLRPETLTLYTTAPPTELALLNRWRTDREPNIFVRRQFWRFPEGEGGDGERSPSARPVQTAPRLLIYADLTASGEARQLEAAKLMRKHDPEFLRV